MDTPGLHKARTKLGDYMVKVVRESVADVDAVCLIVEPIPHVGGPEEELIARIKALNVPAVLIINKIDTVEKEALLAVMAAYAEAHTFQAILPISAKNGEGWRRCWTCSPASCGGPPPVPRGHGDRPA